MGKHIIRIKCDALRIALLMLYFPWMLVDFVLFCALTHPDKRRLLDADFWLTPVYFWWAAAMGVFVPS